MFVLLISTESSTFKAVLDVACPLILDVAGPLLCHIAWLARWPARPLAAALSPLPHFDRLLSTLLVREGFPHWGFRMVKPSTQHRTPEVLVASLTAWEEEHCRPGRATRGSTRGQGEQQGWWAAGFAVTRGRGSPGSHRRCDGSCD